MSSAQASAPRQPPRFEEAQNFRQKSRSAGLDPDHWYAVEYDKTVKKGQIIEVTFWNTSIALYRGQDGELAAVQNRCPHRQLKLTHGAVEGCQLRCAYHGWAFNREGWLTDYSHDSFGKALLKKQLQTYPVAVRYGLIWIFPGDAAKAEQVEIPTIPELEGDAKWASVTADFTWKSHHSMVIDNICDFAHAFLHRKYQPFTDAKLKHYEADENRVFLSYDTFVGGGKISGMFVDRNRINTRSMDLCYEYPYQWADTGGKIKNWCFVVPIDERTTRAFFLFYFDAFIIPMTSLATPKWLTQAILWIAAPLLLKPILAQDGIALEAEQEGYEQYWDAPPIELNPVVPLFQQLTANKREAHLQGLAKPKAAVAEG